MSAEHQGFLGEIQCTGNIVPCHKFQVETVETEETVETVETVETKSTKGCQ